MQIQKPDFDLETSIKMFQDFVKSPDVGILVENFATDPKYTRITSILIFTLLSRGTPFDAGLALAQWLLSYITIKTYGKNATLFDGALALEDALLELAKTDLHAARGLVFGIVTLAPNIEEKIKMATSLLNEIDKSKLN